MNDNVMSENTNPLSVARGSQPWGFSLQKQLLLMALLHSDDTQALQP